MLPREILKQYWEYDAFRPLQEDIIQSVLDGRDTLALLPTGGGKSICFQVPALCLDGICLVVSPLIALMKDQVKNLENRGISAAAIFSGMSRRQIDIIFENACNGQYKFLYLSPERLKTPLAIERIKRMKVCLLAVDEAHCISQWGYDFRPSYLQIATLRTWIPKTPILALTATATTDVVEDIQEKLVFRDKNVFQQSFLRKNLSYSVLYEDRKRDKLLDILKRVPGTGIVYVRSRGETKEIAQFLQQHKISADYYHAGLLPEERNARQDAWLEGKIRIIVCTNAFGMGIDKPDVRIVVHLQLPETLEGYFQEAGRGGRDGLKSYATLLYTPGDGVNLRYQLQTSYPSMDKIRMVYQALGSYTQLAIGAGLGESFDFELSHFCQTYKLEQPSAHAALRVLELEGWIAMSEAAVAPARMLITASREGIYDYQLRNRQADTVLKTLLRAYPGLQTDFVDVSESAIAKYANMSKDAVCKILQAAHRDEVLVYEPKKDKPQLTFIRERVGAENLTIDLDAFTTRKKRAEDRLNKAIQFAEDHVCRSQQLLRYFGEADSPVCGICDVCTGRHKPANVATDFTTYEKKIRAVLKHESLSVEEVLQAFAPKRHEMVTQVLNFLVSEGKLVIDEQERLTCV
jgi:ATP-dependent DNA helicase RecQ